MKTHMKIIYINYYAPALHSMYKNMISSPPEWYIYMSKNSHFEQFQQKQSVSKEIISKAYNLNKVNWFWKFNKKFLSYFINTVKIKDIFYPYFVIPHSWINIIYSTWYIVKNMEVPWILDMEVLHVLNGYNIKNLEKNKVYYQKHLESENCKAIIVWNSNIYDSVISFFSSEIIKEKLHIIRQTIIPSWFIKTDFPEKKVRFLFLWSWNILAASYIRGIKDALIIYRELIKKYDDITLTIAPFLPKELKEEFWDLRWLQSVERLLNAEEMKELYKQTDVLLHPSYSHPAMTLLEAMNYWISILTTNYAAIDDLVKDGYNGIICKNNSLFEYYEPYHMVRKDLSEQVMKYSGKDSSMIEDFVQKASKLIENRELRKHLAYNSLLTVKQGEYSFEYNNQKRKKIYDTAII